MKLGFISLMMILYSCNQSKQVLKNTSETPTFEYSDSYQNLEKKIQTVIDSRHTYVSNPNPTFDIISYTESTTNDIVNFINKYNQNPDNIKGLEKNAEVENIKTYSYGFWSGGTRGFVTYSILTINKDSLFLAANLSENIEARFDSIIKLDNEFYLLFGGDKAYGSAYSNIAYLIKITDKKIDLEYPAFANRPFLSFYNGVYEYDNKSKFLKFQGEWYERIDKIFSYEDKYRKYSKDSLSSEKLYKMIKGKRYYATKSFILKFDGKNFERFDKEDDEYQ